MTGKQPGAAAKPSTQATGATTGAPKPQMPPPEFTGEPRPSVIHDALRQMVFVTGFRGQGKTTFCLGMDNPANICMLDYESKGEGLARPLGVGGYFSVMDDCAQTFGGDFRPIHVYQRTKQIVEAMPSGRFTTLVLDNASLLQDGALEMVKLRPSDFGIDPVKAQTGQYGGAWPGVKYVLRNLFSVARSKGVKVIAVTFQLTKAWGAQGPLLNKFKTTDVALWHEMSVLSLVLVNGRPEHMPAPSALVMKEQLGEMVWDEAAQETRVVRRLPFKLPRATMGEVYRYLREPVDFKALKPGEMPDSGEIDPFLPTFGKEQLRDLERLARAAAELRAKGEGDEGEEGGGE